MGQKGSTLHLSCKSLQYYLTFFIMLLRIRSLIFIKLPGLDPVQPTDQLEIYQLRLRLLVDFQRSASYFFTRLSLEKFRIKAK